MKKLISITLIASFFSTNLCFSAPMPQQFSSDVEAELEQILADTQTQSSQEENNYMVLKAGENFAVELPENFDSQEAAQNDEISAKLLFPIEIDGKVIIPEGSTVKGKIIKLEQSGGWFKNAVADIQFTQIECRDDYKLPILAKIKTKDDSGLLLGASRFDRFQKVFSSLTTISLGGALAGFGIGLMGPYALAGAATGFGLGAVISSGWLFFQKGQPIELPSGTKLIITLQNDISVNGFDI